MHESDLPYDEKKMLDQFGPKTSGGDQAFTSAHVAEDDQERHQELLRLPSSAFETNDSVRDRRFRLAYKTTLT